MHTTDGQLRQMWLLFVFCLAILLISGGWDMISTRLGKNERENVSQFYWDGSQLVVTNDDHLTTDSDTTVKIPSHLNPIFFRPVSINEADEQLLMTVPGIGPKLAGNITVTRSKIGRFANIKDLQKVPGIGEKKARQFEEHFSF